MRNKADYRRWRGMLCVSLIALVALAQMTAFTQSVPAQARAVFYKDSRSDLAAARARGESTVTLAIAAREGMNDSVAGAVASAGGTISYRADDVSYVRARVPIDAVEQLLQSDAIEAAAVDITSSNHPITKWPSLEENDLYAARRAPAVSSAVSKSPGRFATASQNPRRDQVASGLAVDPMRQPYSPLADIGALELRRIHPTYDGRGVIIGHVEGNIDLLAPELKTGYSMDGKPAPKIVDYITARDPDAPADGRDAPDFDQPWVRLEEVATTDTHPEFTARGKRYTAPRPGRFRFGVFDNRPLCALLNRQDFPSVMNNSTAERLGCGWGVLLDPQTRDVWVDTNSDLSFADSKTMRDYAVRGDVGVFGHDDPTTPDDREAYGFAVQTHTGDRWIGIVLGSSGHASMVAGTMSGNRVPNGRYDGIAPGAKLVEIGYEATVSGVTEALITAFRDPRTDLVVYEWDSRVSIGYLLRDGRLAPSIITSRLTAKYNKPYIAPAGNSPGTNIAVEPGNTQWGFSTGAVQGRDSYWINDRVRVRKDQNFHQIGSWGPEGDGALKPDILAPAGILSSKLPSMLAGRGGKKGLYSLPAGYGIGGGTSQAAGSMAGALALLLSAAKQAKIPYDVERVWLAMTGAAQFIPQLEAHKQGNGVIDVGNAFALLKAYKAKPPNIRIKCRAPVHTFLSGNLATPDEGAGIFERIGWHPDMRATRSITFTRTSGPAEPMRFTLSWIGNDGTFAGPASVTLPLGVPTQIEVTIAPKTGGSHSALLQLDHPAIPGHAYRMMATVMVADQFEAARQFTITKTGVIERPGPVTSYAFEVPPGTASLKLDIRMENEGRLVLLDPLGRQEEFNPEMIRTPRSRTVQNPMPGVWEVGISIENDGLDLRWKSPEEAVDPKVPFMLTASIFGAEATPRGEVTSPTGGSSREFEVAITNRFAPAVMGLMPMALGSGRTVSERLKPGEQRVYDITAPEGAELLQVELPQVSDQAAELDLYLFDCTMKCNPVASAVGPGLPRLLRRERPAAGMWKVVVDCSRADSAGVGYTLREVILDPSLGASTSTDAMRRRAAAATWAAPANLWLAKAALEGRTLYLALRVQATSQGGPPAPLGVTLVPLATSSAKR